MATRIAALYDIHGNLPALEAVMPEVLASGADLIVVGGDIMPGPMPREVLDLLAATNLDVQFIRGNGEVAVLDVIAGREPRVGPAYRPVIDWNAQQVRGQADRIAAWPLIITVDVAGIGPVLFCHATPSDENPIFTRRTTDARVAELFEGAPPGLVVCGHTHMQFDRTVGAHRIVNAGSVGMPFGEPGAYWVVIGPDVEFRRTTYGLEGAARRVRMTTYPQADEFARGNILSPPTEEQMLELFGGAGA